MLQGINVEEIKKYNDGLRAHTERAAKIKAELEINTNELNRICEELTAELGVTVTPENIDAIYKENVDKINSTLQTGNEVLRRIAEEEAAINNPVSAVEQPQAVVAPSVSNVGTPQNAGVNINQEAPSFIPNPGAFGVGAQDTTELPPFNMLNSTIKI